MSEGIITDPALIALDAALSQGSSSKMVFIPGGFAAGNRVDRMKLLSDSRAEQRVPIGSSRSEKVMIINFIKNNPSLDQAASTISRYIKDEESKKQKQPQFPQLENCMEFWYYQTLGKGNDPNLIQNLDALRQKWKDFENLLVMRRSKRVQLPYNLFDHFKEDEIERIRLITNQYALEDILAMDEIGLAYSAYVTVLSVKVDSCFNMVSISLEQPCGDDMSNLGEVLLLVDNTHIHLLPEPELAHIQIAFIETSRIGGCYPSESYGHPFIAGITAYFKSEYRVRPPPRESYKTRGTHSGAVTPRTDDDLPQEDALTMCLSQLTIKVMNLSEQTELDQINDYASPEIDANINPLLSASTRKKPEDQIVSATEFIDIDASLPTELEWDDLDIVDQVLKEVGEESLGGLDDAMNGNDSGLSTDLSRVDAVFRSLKRDSSSLDIYMDRLRADTDRNQRKRHSGHQNQRFASRYLLEGSSFDSLPNDDQSLDSLSRFSHHISNIESLRSFCSELIEKNQISDETMSGRVRGSIIGNCLTVLSELEEEFKALEAADLLRHVSR
ncbi:hypothetical protein BY996DRAFT_6518800 [Phakopsora pachyrhizi]|nr:hypothetical protein BY996DRAFT_6518800 [Phakopsora pachyrhizi]